MHKREDADDDGINPQTSGLSGHLGGPLAQQRSSRPASSKVFISLLMQYKQYTKVHGEIHNFAGNFYCAANNVLGPGRIFI